MLARVVLVLGDEGLARHLQEALGRFGVMVDRVDCQDEFWDSLARESCDLLVMSHALVPAPAVASVNALVALPDAPALVIAEMTGTAAEQAHLIAAGCQAVLPLGLDYAAATEVVAALAEKRRFVIGEEATRRGIPDQPRLSDFVSRSPSMQAFMDVVHRVAGSSSSLLILGETGVGKERLARAIHSDSPRGDSPFVAVNCGALPEGLLESELFGHEEGAFTGATRTRRGCFELAHGGTLFLDEVGETPVHLQVKLLRVLQERALQRVGGEKTIHVDVRLVAATSRNLQAEVEARRFRSDLFYRLGVVTLEIPPLRERIEDIPELAESYIDYLAPRIGRDIDGIDPDALAALQHYEWPGNVRELINVVERAMLLSRTGRIRIDDLPAVIGRKEVPVSTIFVDGAGSAEYDDIPEDKHPTLKAVRQQAVARAEKAYLIDLLRKTEGRINLTARRAGIEPRSLHGKMKRHGLRKEDYKP